MKLFLCTAFPVDGDGAVLLFIGFHRLLDELEDLTVGGAPLEPCDVMELME